ncbi:hypothetical protein GCM10009715_22990 [Paeniglutamicibacter psychrophenolicus]|uniref:Transcriptional regulator with XRE-family HTH domain n=1 Tax=Paeniglutamicibacter psychrophenolicus TaxID=257454 RepID=A0ABS4WHP4_9MICC|nr:hypothetical protein [Paeniglutamicibacter psychrophenolicus]MBP2375732.1 transcriptional regulator with XRE-family HTH domain [Paeniglutamicibacter psychrophenolicus]
MLTIQDELAQVFAIGELNRMDRLRACAKASEKGLGQADIAMRLGVSQPEVHRMLRKINNFPSLLQETPRVVILQFHAEKISHGQMMQTLRQWPFTFGEEAETGNPESVLTRGSWDEITDAFHRDLIDIDDYEELVRVVTSTAE